MGISNMKPSSKASDMRNILLENIRKSQEEEARALAEKCKSVKKEFADEKDAKNIDDLKNAKYKKQQALSEFNESTLEKLLIESIYAIYDKALDGKGNYAVKRNYVASFIKEEKMYPLMNKFSSKTEFLCEMVANIKDFHKRIMEATDKEDENTFMIDTSIQDEFFDSLKTDSVDDMADAIKAKVASSINDFILANQQDAQKTLDAMSQLNPEEGTGDEVDAVMGESYGVVFTKKNLAMRTINSLKGRRQSLFETMVWAIAESAHKNEAIKEAFTTNGKLRMDDIIESAEVMYTFLETISTTKMVDLNEAYIDKVYRDLKA